jgi:hypothetical protein
VLGMLEFFSPAHMGKIYGRSPDVIKGYCRRKLLPATKLRSGHWIITASDAHAFAKARGWKRMAS